jgi:hypothetical protein
VALVCIHRRIISFRRVKLAIPSLCLNLSLRRRQHHRYDTQSLHGSGIVALIARISSLVAKHLHTISQVRIQLGSRDTLIKLSDFFFAGGLSPQGKQPD